MTFKRSDHETDLSTPSTAAGADPRFSFADGHQGRAQGDQPAARQRAQAPRHLSPEGALRRAGLPARRGREPRAGAVKPSETTRFGFPRTLRLLRRRDFVRLSRTGRRVQNEQFILCFAPGRGDAVRLGITVSRRVGGAVVRNRIKRLCREAFRLQQHRISGCWDLLLIAKKQAAARDNETLRQSLSDLFRHLKG